MRGWSKAHLYAGISIVLVVVIAGCCFVGIVQRLFGAHGDGYAYGPRTFIWTPWTLITGLIGRLFGLGVAVIVIAAVVLFVLWITGRISITWRGPGNRP